MGRAKEAIGRVKYALNFRVTFYVLSRLMMLGGAGALRANVENALWQIETKRSYGGAMRDQTLALANSAAVLSTVFSRRADPVCCSRRCWGVRFPELKTWSASFRAAAICIFCILICVACGTPVMARGGFRHEMAGFGMHDGHRMGAGGAEGLLTPAYVLITVSKITDAGAFQITMRDLMAAETPFAGRLAVDMDKPVSWEGTAPEHVVMIQFDNSDQALAWKNSDAFKTFDAQLHRSSESTIQLVQVLPTPAARGIGLGRRGRGNIRFDQKAFEPNVKEYDQMLNKMRGICKGC
jgi:uncharacterized protein (DUF1330 family)